MSKVKRIIISKKLGNIVSANVLCWLYKHKKYYNEKLIKLPNTAQCFDYPQISIKPKKHEKNKEIIFFSLQNLFKLLPEDDYLFLDVRSIEEHKVKAIPNTPNIPVQELENRIDELKIYRDKKIIVYCRSGNRSKLGTDILTKNGYDAVNLIGGMNQWEGPIISEK